MIVYSQLTLQPSLSQPHSQSTLSALSDHCLAHLTWLPVAVYLGVRPNAYVSTNLHTTHA